MPPHNRERDISTDRIQRAVEDALGERARPPSGEIAIPCREHESRIIHLEKGQDELRAVAKDHESRLHAGDLGFADLRKDVGSLTEKVGELTGAIKDAVRWVLGAVGTLAVGAIVWALVQSQKPDAAPTPAPAPRAPAQAVAP